MSLRPPVAPLRYSPFVETVPEDEAETGRALDETMGQIRETTLKHGGHALRSVHAKSHGLLEGELEVLSDLPPSLAQGLFARAGRYPVVMRFSTIPGDVLDDSVSTPRGLAVKIIGVEGERLPGSEGDVTQDLVLVNGPAFGAPDPKAFLKTLKLLAATTDRIEGVKKAVSAALRRVEAIVEAFGGKSPTLMTLGGQPETHILGDSFFTQAALRFGDHVAKLSVVPVSPGLTALTNAPLDLNGAPDGIRAAVVDFFEADGGEWDLRAQLCTNTDEMPIEDASVVWPEDRSPYVPVARIRVGPQTAWSPARASAVDDGLSFSPWHGLAAHRPLGGVMRVRKAAYEMSKRFRAQHNARPIAEPRGALNLPN